MKASTNAIRQMIAAMKVESPVLSDFDFDQPKVSITCRIAKNGRIVTSFSCLTWSRVGDEKTIVTGHGATLSLAFQDWQSELWKRGNSLTAGPAPALPAPEGAAR